MCSGDMNADAAIERMRQQDQQTDGWGVPAGVRRTQPTGGTVSRGPGDVPAASLEAAERERDAERERADKAEEGARVLSERWRGLLADAEDELTAERELRSSLRLDRDSVEHARLRDNEYLLGRAKQAEARVRRLEDALRQSAVPLEVLRGQIPYIRTGPLGRKIKALSPNLEAAIVSATDAIRGTLSPDETAGDDG